MALLKTIIITIGTSAIALLIGVSMFKLFKLEQDRREIMVRVVPISDECQMFVAALADTNQWTLSSRGIIRHKNGQVCIGVYSNIFYDDVPVEFDCVAVKSALAELRSKLNQRYQNLLLRSIRGDGAAP